MITINNNIEEIQGQIFMYCSDNQLIGEIKTFSAFLDANVQVKNQAKTGYYYQFIDNNNIIHILPINRIGNNEWPEGFFSNIANLLDSL